jgi:hypothetical protein
MSPVSPFLPVPSFLVTPDEVEQAAIDLLAVNHSRHLAAFERQRGLAPRTIGRFETIDLFREGQQFSQDVLPAVFVGAFSLAESPADRKQQDGSWTWDTFWRLELHVVTLGGGRDPRADSMQRCRWMTMTALECLLRRLPGYATTIPVGAVHPIDVVFEADTSSAGGDLAHGEAALSVQVPSAITGLGGPLVIEDADPYVAPHGVRIEQAPVDVTLDPLT